MRDEQLPDPAAACGGCGDKCGDAGDRACAVDAGDAREADEAEGMVVVIDCDDGGAAVATERGETRGDVCLSSWMSELCEERGDGVGVVRGGGAE